MKLRLTKILRFLWENFGPMLAFQLVYRQWGYRVGAAASIVVALAECAWLWKKRRKPSALFLFSTSLCVIFGVFDLFFGGSRFMVYESPAINLFIAGVFAWSLKDETSFVQKIVETKQPLRHLAAEDRSWFFRVFTAVWAGYYLARAGAFLWINLHAGVGEGFLLRLIVGNVSLAVMIALSTLGGRPLWKLAHRLRLFPSQNAATLPAEL